MQQQIEQALRKIIDTHNFNNNEGFSCLISDKEPYPSNEGLLLWFSSKTRIETKIQLFHSPPRIRRMEEMLNLPEKEYVKLFFGYLEDFLNTLREIGFENIGKGVDLFGKGKLFNVKADFELFENNPAALKEFELATIDNPIVKFAEEQGYFNCANRTHLVWDEFASGIDFSTTASETTSAAKRSSGSKTVKPKAGVAEAVVEKSKTPVSKGKSKPPAKTIPTKALAPKAVVASKSAKVIKAAAPVSKATAKVVPAKVVAKTSKPVVKATTKAKAPPPPPAKASTTTAKAKGKVTAAKVTAKPVSRPAVTTTDKAKSASNTVNKKSKATPSKQKKTGK